MKQRVRVFEMHKDSGTFEDVYQLYRWLGKISTADAGHNFDIKVSIVETKEVEEEE